MFALKVFPTTKNVGRKLQSNMQLRRYYGGADKYSDLFDFTACEMELRVQVLRRTFQTAQ